MDEQYVESSLKNITNRNTKVFCSNMTLLNFKSINENILEMI